LRLSSVTSAAGSREYQTHASIPHLYGSWEMSAKAGQEQQLSWLGYQQSLKTLSLTYKPNAASAHQLIAEYSLRDEVPNRSTSSVAGGEYVSALVGGSAVATPSAAVLCTATSSLKASLKHIWTAVDDQKLEQSGRNQHLQVALELAAAPWLKAGTACAGLGQAAEFVKADITGRYERQLGPSLYSQPGLTLSVGGHVGVMYPLGLLLPALSSQRNEPSSVQPFTSFLSDRYHLGGPLSLRGFAPGGVGVRAADKQDSLGGDTKSSFVALLSVPVPFPALAAASMRAFAFANVGSLGNSDYWCMGISNAADGSSVLKSKFIPLFGYIRASVGAGLSLSLGGVARVEATYSLPLLKAKHDVTSNAFQLGVGLSIS
jgi:hypothetical protein